MNSKPLSAGRRLPLTMCALALSGVVACGDLASVDCSYYTDPVCGIDGKTYPNECYASLAGIQTYVKGTCPPIVCTATPVCGSDGETYRSNCFAELGGVTDYVPGRCPFSPCTGPVCGRDGVTYASDCFARLSGVLSWVDGPCS